VQQELPLEQQSLVFWLVTPTQHSLTGSQQSEPGKQQPKLLYAASPPTHNAPAITTAAHNFVNMNILLVGRLLIQIKKHGLIGVHYRSASNILPRKCSAQPDAMQDVKS
jgi:hypothetical protein